MSFKVFEISFNKDVFNYFQLFIEIPRFYWNSRSTDSMGYHQDAFGVEADTRLTLKYEDGFDQFWSLSVVIFGLGFQIVRQKGC